METLQSNDMKSFMDSRKSNDNITYYIKSAFINNIIYTFILVGKNLTKRIKYTLM